MKKKVFISQPMGNRTPEQIMNERQVIENKLKAHGYKVIDSVLDPKDHSLVYMLGKSIQLMSKADVVYFMNGWKNSRGCKVERLIAEDYDLEILDYETDNLD